MKCTPVISLFAIVFVSCCVIALPAQDAVTSGPELHSRQEPLPQPPAEQLLPPSSVAPFVVPTPKKYPQKYASVYMPVSLAVGRVRTPEFLVEKRSQWYDIVLQVEKPLPFLRMQCMMGVTSGPLDERYCEKDDPILRADWTVWEGGHIVQWGSIPDRCGCKFEDKRISKEIGFFPLEAGKKYVVQVHFTKDGTALNVASPRLIVIPHQDMW